MRCPLTNVVCSARQAEVFAGFLEQTDHEVGRLRRCAIEDIGEMDNTLFIYIAGDNGTSAEGGFVGMYNEMTYFNNVTEKVEDLVPLIDKWGGPETFPHMAAGWAVAFDSPFSWTKQVASDFGGTRNGMIIHWPQGIKDKGGLRSQFGHVIDIAPTILEATGLPEPKSVNGTPQTPIEGESLLYSFNDAECRRAAHDPVLRDVRQPGDLSRGLARSNPPPSPLANRGYAAIGVGRLGSVQRPRGLQPYQQPG